MAADQSVYKLISIACIYAFFVAPANADTLVNREEITLDIILGLIAIIAVIVVLGWLANYLKNNSGYSGNGKLKLISQLPIGVKERIAIVDVGSQQIVIGVTATSINKLHVLEDQERFLPIDNTKKTNIINKDRVVRTHAAFEWLVEKIINGIKSGVKKPHCSKADHNNAPPLNEVHPKAEENDFKGIFEKYTNVVSIKDKQ